MINYLLKSGLLLLIFYAVYKLLLENEKMFRFNRAYLLGSLVFSLIVPLQLFSIRSLLFDKIMVIQLDEIVIRTSKTVTESVNYNELFWFAAILIYVIITVILTARFFKNLYSFYKTSKNNRSQIIENQKIVLVKKSILPHSFWNAIFINKEEFENGKIPNELIAHEKAHLLQKHSLDILFVSVLQIVFWFNPLIILFEKAIKLNHEFLADEAVNKQFGEIKNYQSLLLDFASYRNTVSLASNINYLITKKRLLMMTKKESPIKIVLKVFSVGLIYALSLFVFSTETIAQEKKEIPVSTENKTLIVNPSEVKPDFPGGMIEFYKFVGQRFKVPAEVAKHKADLKVFMQFMVEKDGSLSEFKAVKGDVYGIGDEAIRVLKLSPKWIPATQDGKPTRVLYDLPITIQSEK